MSILQAEGSVVAATDSGELEVEEPSSAQQSPPPKIDLHTCAPDELAAWLLAHRFQESAMDVASFLLNCTSTLPNAEEISAQLLGGGGNDEEDDDSEDEDTEEGDGHDETEAEPVAQKPAADPQTEHLQTILDSSPQSKFANINNNEIEVSCTNPRGKLLLSTYKNGILLTNPKKRTEEQISISSINVKDVIWFRKPEDYKKVKQLNDNNGDGGKKKGKQGAPGHMVLICLEDDEASDVGVTKFRSKPLKQVCFQLPTYPQFSSADENDDNKQLTEEDWYNGLRSALFSESENGILRVQASMDIPAYSSKGRCGGYMFQSEGEPGSTTTTEAMPYVGCYQGFNDGALFPLKEGLLFFKPPLFVPRSKLASISCGRGSGGSRYVDMMVQLDVTHDSNEEQEGAKKKKKQSGTLEFTNIHRDELPGLNDYIHKTLIPAMQADADGDAEGSNDDSDDDSEEAVAEVVDGSEDEDEESDEAREEEEEDSVSRKRRPSRAAKLLARETTRAALKGIPTAANDSDDSDVFEEEEESDDSDDDSVVSDGESGASSSEDGEDEDVEEVDLMDDDSDGSDYDGRKGKKARTE